MAVVHSWPGKSVCDDGIVIDLSQMHTVTADPDKRRAYAQGGALLGALDAAAHEHGLITTGGVVSHTGVGGYTLGGGFGRLNRSYGLTIDVLRSAEIITADGKVRRISEEEEPDLFWAIRGGGGNFGVVTEFEYELYPFNRNLLSGGIVWPIDQARDVLEFYAAGTRGCQMSSTCWPSDGHDAPTARVFSSWRSSTTAIRLLAKKRWRHCVLSERRWMMA